MTKNSYVIKQVENSHDNSLMMVALIDTGNEINMMRYKKYDELGKLSFSTVLILITGMDQHEIKMINDSEQI